MSRGFLRYSTRVAVASVRFDKTAYLEFEFDNSRSRQQVLDQISSIEHTGDLASVP